jgi:hypothetical protein
VVDFTGGGVVIAGGGAGVGGVGDRLGAVSVLNEYLALGTAPEVEGLGDNGVVLGLDEVFEEVMKEVLPEPRCWLLVV